MERCKLCNGKGKTGPEGKEVICKCRLIPAWEQKLGPLVKCGKVSQAVKKAVMSLIEFHKKQEKPTPKHYYIVDSIKRAPHPRKWYRGFFAYYLVKSMEFMDFKYVEFSMLNEAFFSDKTAAASMSEDVRYFDLPHKTIILVCSGKPSSKISEDILRTFLDTYKDRNVFIYFSKAAQEGVKKKEWEWDGKTRKEKEVTVLAGLHHVVMTEPYSFVNIAETWKL